MEEWEKRKIFFWELIYSFNIRKSTDFLYIIRKSLQLLKFFTLIKFSINTHGFHLNYLEIFYVISMYFLFFNIIFYLFYCYITLIDPIFL